MTLHVKDAGVWKEVTIPSVKDAGAWKEVQEGWVKDAGTWKMFYQNLLVQLTSFNVTSTRIAPATATAGVRMTSTGLQQSNDDGVYTTEDTWLQAGVNSDYEVRVTVNSGSLTAGSTGTWLPMTSTRDWYVADSAGTFPTANITLELRLAASPFTVLASSTHILTASQEV